VIAPRRIAGFVLLACLCLLGVACGDDGSYPCNPGFCGPVGEEALRLAVARLPAGQEVYWLGSEGLEGDGADGSFPWAVNYRIDEGSIILVTYQPGQVLGRDYTLPSGFRFLLRIRPLGGEFVEIYGGPGVTRAVAERIAADLRPVPRD
jgi:hypothetical protein